MEDKDDLGNEAQRCDAAITKNSVRAVRLAQTDFVDNTQG